MNTLYRRTAVFAAIAVVGFAYAFGLSEFVLPGNVGVLELALGGASTAGLIGTAGAALGVGSIRQMLPNPIVGYSKAQLRDKLEVKGNMEANPDVLFTTVTYVAAGQAQLIAFNGRPAGTTSSNIDGNTGIPKDQFFSIQRIFVTPLRRVTDSATVAGVLDDIQAIYNVARGMVTFNYKSKPVGPIPLRYFGDGGQAGGLIAAANPAARTYQLGRGAENGGFPINGAWMLEGAEPFTFNLDFVAATAVSADTPLEVALFGIRYRPVG